MQVRKVDPGKLIWETIYKTHIAILLSYFGKKQWQCVYGKQLFKTDVNVG